MTETNKDGEKIAGPENRKETNTSGKIISLSQGGEAKKDASQTDPGDAPKKADPTIGVDQEETLIVIHIPFSVGLWRAMGFIYEVMIPTVRRLMLEKAQKSALKNRLISPPKGFRGFNPMKSLFGK